VTDVPAETHAQFVLSEDDRRILALLASGFSSQTVARMLNTSSRTLRRRVRCVCEQMGVQTPVEAIALAARRHLI